MASTAPAQIDASSIDQLGVSVVTTTKSATNSRFGSIYDPTTLAAGAPVHVHPMLNGNQAITAFSQRWTAATASQTTPGFYSAYTIDPTPTWFLTDQTGARTSLGGSPAVPVITPATTLTLRDGTGRSPYLYLLHTATTDGVSNGLLQHFRETSQGGLAAVDEEVIPNLASPAVTFDKGVDFNNTNLTVYGTDASGNLYMARKGFGAVGVSASTDPKTGLTTNLGWQYHTGSGWSAKPTDAAPFAGITSKGPVSVANYGNYRYISTVKANGAAMSAQVFRRYLGAKPGAWSAMGAPVALGSTADGSYLGGTLQLQPLLLASSSVVDSPASSTAIPAVSSVKSRVSSQDSLVVTWSALQIPRQS